MSSQKILITGGAGFIGHHIINKLLNNTNYQLISLDRLDYSGTYNRIQEIIDNNTLWKKRIKIVWHDLKAEINPMIKKQIGDPEIILHVAAASHVDRSIKDPMSFVLDNIVGTTNLLEFARRNKKLKKFLYFSTDEVFGPAPNNIKYKENDRYRSGNPYAATKAGAEELCVAYTNTYKMPIIITHTMNVFGERQHPEKFIPKIISSLIKKKEITIHSDKNKKTPGSRFYIHAEDVADAVLFLLSRGKIDQKYNIVGSKEINNLNLAKIVAKHLNINLKFKMVDFHSARPGHDLRYALSGQKLKKMGWQPKKNIERRIKQTVDWTIKNKRWL
jgi:dTDP-glucose 4,6-dehydratase|tara:strand:- start:603 stop:1595 length:993 start_codon:yes stop_codon:yes gene_type:complete